MAVFKDIKALVVNSLHEDLLAKFKEYFAKQNSREPTQKEINAFFSLLIAEGNIDKEADEITKGLIKKALSGGKIRNIFINTTYTIPLCTVLVLFLLCLTQGQIPDFLKSGGYYYGALVSAMLLLLFTVVFTVIAITKSDK